MKFFLTKHIWNILPVVLLTGLLFSSGCDDDPKPINLPKNEIQLTLNHQWDGGELILNNWYKTANGDSFQLTRLIYHINNFELIDENGVAYPADTKWFMVTSETSLKPTFTMGDLNDKKFKAIRFVVGVEDSATNASGALNSVFTEPMYWGMANGYINFKLEGKSPSVGNQGVILHIGGYLGALKAVTKVQVDFGAGNLAQSIIGSNNITLNANLAEFFDNPNLINLATTNEIHTPSAEAVLISQNWQSMYTFASIK